MPARLVAVAILGLTACAPAVGTRTLHVVDGDLVFSRPVSARAYEAYVRARLALEASPPRLEEAQRNAVAALRHDPHEPQLWTTRAEIEWRAGDVDAAVVSCGRALQLRPDYPPARTLMAQLEGGGSPASASVAAPPG